MSHKRSGFLGALLDGPDLVLLHPPAIYRFRETPTFCGPVSDVVPSSSVFELYPIGFLTIASYLHRHGLSVRIINVAMKMIRRRSFDPEKLLAKLRPAAFGIDLHWLPHVDGSLSLAAAAKRRHPEVPVILGGISASYFHEEIMRDYPFVDFIVCGDSTEEPLRQLLLAIKSGGGFDGIPNLVWRQRNEIRKNPQWHRPQTLDYFGYDYPHFLRMALRHRDLFGYMPFQRWFANPITAALSCRGCSHNCASCGGSSSGFRIAGFRDRPCFRSPERLAEDVRQISRLTGAPIMLIGDLLQNGEEYARRFLDAIRPYDIANEVVLEFFRPPSDEFVRLIPKAIPHFDVEISPESHDEIVRERFGKHYSNAALENTIDQFIRCGARRVDLFFMIGLPEQDYASVMKSVAYAGELLNRFPNGKILPMIAPLAPFIDPGSPIFEQPEKFGYRLYCRTLKEHRQAMLRPSWKDTLNYETRWMSRNDIVRATYDSALQLSQIKLQHGLITRAQAEEIRRSIAIAKALMDKIDAAHAIDSRLASEIIAANERSCLCHRRELAWPVKGRTLRLMNAIKMLVGFKSAKVAEEDPPIA